MVYILLIAIGLAMDAFSVSIALGSATNKKALSKGVISSAMFGGFQAIMPLVGWVIGETSKPFVSNIDHWVAFILLFGIGLKMIYGSFSESKGLINQENIDFRLLLSLAFATSIDALIIGMGIAFIGVPIILAITVIGLITFSLSMLGIYLGKKCSGFLQNRAGLVGGLILILIGIKVLTDHVFI